MKHHMSIFATEYKAEETLTNSHLLRIQSISRQEMIKSTGSHYKKEQMLTGDYLIAYILIKYYNYLIDEIELTNTSFGRPMIKSKIPIFISLSHSEKWVVCAFDNEPVGIDIQKIVNIPRKRMDVIVLRFFHKYEQIQYFNLKEMEKDNFFFTQWALKESYIKLPGKGLRIPLQSFSAFLDQNGSGSISDGGHIRYFQQYNIDSNYKLIACSSNSSFPLSVKKISTPSITKI